MHTCCASAIKRTWLSSAHQHTAQQLPSDLRSPLDRRTVVPEEAFWRSPLSGTHACFCLHSLTTSLPAFFFSPFFNAILPVIHSTLHWIIHRLLPELLPTSQCRPLFSIYHHFPVKAQNSSAKSDSYLVYLALNPLGLFSLPVLLCSPKHFKHLNPKVHLLKSVLEQRGTSVNSYLRYIHTFPCLYLTFLPERKSLIFVAVERRCSSCSEDGEAARPGPSHSFSLWLQPVSFSCMHCVFSFNGFQMCLNTCKMTAQNAKNLITAYYIYFMSSAIVVLWCPGVFVWFYFGFARANTG